MKIFINFYYDLDKPMFICCHNFWDYDIINDNQTRVNVLFYDEFFTSWKVSFHGNNLIEIF